MKRFTTFLLTLFLITLGASAQTDYTWALGSGTWTGNSGTYGSGVEVYQTTAFSSGKVLYETVTGLPAGEYELTFYAVPNYTSGRGFTVAYGDGIAQVYATANGTTQTKDVTVIDQAGCEPSEYPYEFTVEVGDDGTLEYGLQNIATGGNWYVCQGVSLMFSGEATTRELEPGDVVEEELGSESSLSHYSLTYTGSGSNGGLDYNTWSGESGMTTPYHQVWVYMGDNKNVTLSDMTINHYEIPLLPAGTYTVTVDARVLSEADNAINEGSAFFCANDVSVDIVAEATTDEEFEYGDPAAEEHEVNGTYTLTATVGDDGTLDISFTIKDATYNWISWKNLSVVYVGEAEEEEPGPEEPTDIDSDYQPGDVITVDGVEYTVLDENEISNHSFELGFEGWTKASDFTTTIDEDFELRTDDPENGVNYLVGTSTSGSSSVAGASGTSSLGTAWPIEAGATYVFTYWLKQTDMSQSVELNYIVTSLTNEPGTETEKLAEPTISEEWQPIQYVFTNDEGYKYVQVDFRWLKGRYGFDNFSLHKVEAPEVEPEPTPEPVVEEGDYLIVDAEGNYLGGGLVYGTQAATIGKPQFIGFEVQANGTYHLDSHQYNNASAHYLGSNLYFDNGTPVDWTVAEVEGGITIYGTVDTGTGYLTSNGFQTEASVEADPYVWTLVTIDDVIAGMDEASADAPVDVTALIDAPELKRNSNSSYYPTWTVTGYDGTGTPSNYAFGGNNAIASCAESYHSTNGFNFSQEITLPLAGTYTLSAQGFYRDDNSTTLLLPVMYVDDQSVEFPEITRTDEYLGVTDNMANAYQEFLLGLHPIDAITITAEEDGETVTIGFKGEDTSLWQIMGELTLLYSGAEEVEPEPEVTGTYEFVCTDWVGVSGRSADDGQVAYSDNTITVNATGNNNIALFNGAGENSVNTANYYITEDQTYFVVTGTGLHVEAEDNTYSQLWWMNGVGGPTAKPDYVVELTDDTTGEATGEVFFAWDLTTITEYSSVLTPDADGKIYLTGWTGFGLTSTTGTSVISDINFYTEKEVNDIISGVATRIDAVETAVPVEDGAIYDLSGRKVAKAVKGVYIINGKKVLVK